MAKVRIPGYGMVEGRGKHLARLWRHLDESGDPLAVAHRFDVSQPGDRTGPRVARMRWVPGTRRHLYWDSTEMTLIPLDCYAAIVDRDRYLGSGR